MLVATELGLRGLSPEFFRSVLIDALLAWILVAEIAGNPGSSRTEAFASSAVADVFVLRLRLALGRK